jgi:hypothetical protein
LPDPLPTNVVYDLFAIDLAGQRDILESYADVVVTEDVVGNVSFDSNTDFLRIQSSGGISSIVIGDGGFVIPSEFGFEVSILMPTGGLPADFSSLGTDRVFVGIENNSGSFDLVAGFLISDAGIALAASSTSLLPGDPILPGTAALVALFRASSGVPLTLRAAFVSDTLVVPTLHKLSIAVGELPRDVLVFEETSLPFSYTGPNDRLNAEVMGAGRELLIRDMRLSTTLKTYAITTQLNPGPDQIVELGDVVRMDGRLALPTEAVIISGTDLRSAALEPAFDSLTQTFITRTGNTVAGTGFTDTFTVTAPGSLLTAFPNTDIGDFIEINGVSYIIASLAAFPNITVEEVGIPLGLTGAVWQTYSRDIVESLSVDLSGAVVGDVVRVNDTDNSGVYVVAERLGPSRLRLTSDLPSAEIGMDFEIGPNLSPPKLLVWTFLSGPADTEIENFVGVHRNGSVIRFIPDVVGTYRFEIQASGKDFVPSFIDIVVEVLPSRTSPGEIPSAEFLWDAISDFWSLLPDRGPISTIWSGLIQILSDELLKLYQTDYNKSLKDIQRTFRRKWQKLETSQALTNPVLSQPLPFTSSLRLLGGAGRTFQDGVFESSVGTFLTSGVQPGDTIEFSDGVFAIASVISETRLQLIGDVTPELESLIWEIRIGLYVEAEEDLEVLKMSPGDTVRFVMTATNGNVFRAEEEILAVIGRRAFIRSSTPQIDFALVARTLGYSDIKTLVNGIFQPAFDIEGLRRHIAFQTNVLIVKVPLLQEAVVNPPTTFLHNQNFLLESKLLRFIQDFEGRLPFSVEKASGTTGSTLTEQTFEDTAALFQTRGVAVGDKLHLGTFVFKISSVLSETQLTVEGSMEADQENLTWKIDRIAPDRLWAEFIDLDNSPSIQANFGYLVNLSKSSIEQRVKFDYLSAVRGLFHSFFTGPKVDAIRVGLELLNGLAVSEEAGEIIEITAPLDARIGRIRIRDIANSTIVRVYFYPASLGLAEIEDPTTEILRELKVGDIVGRFQSLAKGVTVTDYKIDPVWWRPAAAQGLIHEIQKYATWRATISSDIFDLSNLDFIRAFIEAIKPKYTQAVLLIALTLLFDEIEVADSMSLEASLDLTDGVFVPPFSLDRRDGAGAPLYRLDFDTNFPISLSPHLELAEVSKYDDLFGGGLPPLARASDIIDRYYEVMKSSTTRDGLGSVQPDGITFVATTAAFSASDVGKVININGQLRTIATFSISTTITLTTSISVFIAVPWNIALSSGVVTFDGSTVGALDDVSAQFYNPSVVPLIDSGDFLEIVLGGQPVLFHVRESSTMTHLEFDSYTVLFDSSSPAHIAGIHTDVAWRLFRGLRYMPKPALNDPDFGSNNTLNESLVPGGYLNTYSVDSDPTPLDNTVGEIMLQSFLSDDDVEDLLNAYSLFPSDMSIIVEFIDETIRTTSGIQTIDGSPVVFQGLPVVKKIVLHDVFAFTNPTPDPEDSNGLDYDAKQIDVYISADGSLLSWTLFQTFNGGTGTPKAVRQNNQTTLVFPTPPPANIIAFKLSFPDGLYSPDGNGLEISEVQLYLSEEFEHLKKNLHLDLHLDSRPEDVLSFIRTLADGNSITGMGSTVGGPPWDTFEDDDAARIVFCSYDLGKTITINGTEVVKIVDVIAEPNALRRIKVSPDLSGALAGVSWDITASGADIQDGEVV